MRTKEEAHDYRYFPDPDLLPLEFDDAYVEMLREGLPELPDEKRARFQSEYGMNAYNAEVLSSDRAAAEFFESVISNLQDKFQTIGKARVASQVGFFVTGEVFAALNRESRPIADLPVSPEQVATLLRMMFERQISGTTAREVFKTIWSEGGDPREIVEARGLKQVIDTGEIEKLVDQLIAAKPDKAAQAKEKPALVGWFVGQAMKASRGKANPQAVNTLLRQKLGVE
jgi:aspartyl-tRNA(Asn)/glutamyl-tRNA(Gln) amidotransferase subunit B